MSAMRAGSLLALLIVTSMASRIVVAVETWAQRCAVASMKCGATPSERAAAAAAAGYPELSLAQALDAESIACARCSERAIVLAIKADALAQLQRGPEAIAALRQAEALLLEEGGRERVLAGVLVQLASMSGRLFDADQAWTAMHHAMNLYHRLGITAGAEYAQALKTRGVLFARKEALVATLRDWRAAYETFHRAQPGGRGEIESLVLLAYYAYEVDADLELARELIERAQRLNAPLGQDNKTSASLAFHHARIEELTGDFDAAVPHIARAIEINTRLGVESRDLAIQWAALGAIHVKAGRFAAAGQAFDRAQTIVERGDVDGLWRVGISAHMGWLEVARGDGEAAFAHFRGGLHSILQLQPGGTEEASLRLGLGRAEQMRGRSAAAMAELELARGLFEKIAPASFGHADALFTLAQSEQAAGLPTAAAHYCDAERWLRSARARAGGVSHEAVFRDRHADVFYRCMESHLQSNDPLSALRVLEHARSHETKSMFGERGDGLRSLVSPAAWVDFDASASALEALLAAATPAASVGAGTPSEAVGRRAGALRATLHRIAPRAAAVFYPAEPAIDKLSNVLSPTTTALMYAVGEHHTTLLIVRRAVIRSMRLEVSRERLTHDVAALRRAIERGREGDLPRILDLSRRLGRMLIAPAQPEIAASRMLLLSPDGPLHGLPFAALQYEDRPRYLIEQLPIAFIDGLSELAPASRGGIAALDLLAIADPKPSAATLARVSGFEAEIAGLARLPATREEVVRIQALMPGRTRLLIDDDATEQAVVDFAPDARVIHFATHALIDHRRPMNSSIVLSGGVLPGTGNDGVLQVWEVFADAALDTDLVVLAACESGSGREFRGAGVMGFPRAFRFAGARRVVASLWAVADRSTADFMAQFYAARNARGDDAVALREAMLAMLAESDIEAGPTHRGVGALVARRFDRLSGAHPFHWAAFRLYGADGGSLPTQP